MLMTTTRMAVVNRNLTAAAATQLSLQLPSRSRTAAEAVSLVLSAADAADDAIGFLASAAMSFEACSPVDLEHEADGNDNASVWTTEMLRLLDATGAGALATCNAVATAATAATSLASAAVVPGPQGTFADAIHTQSAASGSLQGHVWMYTAVDYGLYRCRAATATLPLALNDVFFASAAAADGSLEAFSITLGTRTLSLLDDGDEAGWELRTEAEADEQESAAEAEVTTRFLQLPVDNTVAELQVCVCAADLRAMVGSGLGWGSGWAKPRQSPNPHTGLRVGRNKTPFL